MHLLFFSIMLILSVGGSILWSSFIREEFQGTALESWTILISLLGAFIWGIAIGGLYIRLLS